MHIKILGTGCSKCKKLEANARMAIEESGVEATIEKVEDIKVIMSYGVMKTPALIIDEELKSKGKVLSSKEIMKFLA
jgi:small redox-active disulfide protein 2